LKDMDEVLANGLSSNAEVRLSHWNLRVVKCSSGPGGCVCIVFGMLVAVDIELFSDCQLAFMVFILMALYMDKLGSGWDTLQYRIKDCQIYIVVIVGSFSWDKEWRDEACL